VQSRIVLVALIGLSFVFLVGIGREVVRRYSLDQQFSDLDQRIAELEEQNATLTGRIAYFQSDTYREEQARLKLGFTQPGEQTVTVPTGSGTPDEIVVETATTNATTQHNIENWIQYFFKKNT
jgi:cell division protein FtsB